MIRKASVRLREKTADDARQDYIWQSDKALCDLNAAEPIFMPFEDYARLYAQNINNGSLGIQLAIIVDNKHIGNVAAYNINPLLGTAEVGIIIGDPSYRQKGYGTQAMKKLIKKAFADKNVNKLKLKTLKENVAAQKSFAKCGFKKTDESFLKQRLFVLMELSRDDYEQSKD